MVIAAPGELPVEPQSVLAAVERQFRFVPYLGREGLHIRPGDIGRVGYNEVADTVGQAGEHIGLHRLHLTGGQGGDIPAQVGKRLIRELCRQDTGIGAAAGKGQGNGAAAAAQIPDHRARGGGEPFQTGVHHRFGVRPGDQHPGPHCQGQAVELPFPQQVLEGFAAPEPGQGVLCPGLPVLGAGVSGMGNEPGLFLPRKPPQQLGSVKTGAFRPQFCEFLFQAALERMDRHLSSPTGRCRHWGYRAASRQWLLRCVRYPVRQW